MRYLLLQLMFVLIPLCSFAQKDGKIKFGEYASYKGGVSNNTPMGEGTLTYKWEESTITVRMVDKITGNFSDKIVENATVDFAARGCSYRGKLKFEIGERGKLIITMISGVLNLKGNEYNIENEIYQADGEKSTCGFGTIDEYGDKSYLKTTDHQIRESMLTMYNEDIFKKTMRLPIQAKSYVFVVTRASTDRYEGCRIEIYDKVLGYRGDELIGVRYDGKVCIYTSVSKKTVIGCTGRITKNQGLYHINAKHIQFIRYLFDGTVVKGKKYEPSSERLQGQDTDYGNQELFTGEIVYSNGDVFEGKFILDSENCKSFYDLIENATLQNITLGSGVTTTTTGEKIISKSVHEKRRDEVIREIEKCDSIWNLKMNKSNMSAVKAHLAGKTFAYGKKVIKDNYLFAISVEFVNEKTVKISSGLLPLTERAMPSTKQDLGVMLSMFSSISEKIDYSGEYALIDGHIYLRRDNRNALVSVSKKEIINSADVYSAELCLKDMKDMMQKLDVYNNFSSLKSKQPIPFISEEQIYHLDK